MAKYNAAGLILQTAFIPFKRLGALYRHAETRDRDQAFVKSFQPTLTADSQRQRDFENAMLRFAALHDEINIGYTFLGRVRRFVIVTERVVLSAEKQKEILVREDVKAFVEEEERLVAAEGLV